MKILQVTNLFSPVHGGSAEAPYRLSKELAKRGHEVTLYTSDFKLGQEYILSIPEVKIRAFKTWLGLAEFHVTPGIIKQPKDEIRQFDIIHMHNYRTFQNIVVHHYAKKCGVPYVLQAHGSLATFFQKGWLKRTFDRIWGYGLLRDAGKLIAVSPIEAEQYRNIGINEHKIEIVPNGIDLSEFDNLPQRGEFRRRYSLGSDQRIILYLGRIHKIKGLDLLVKAFADLSRPLSDVRLVIVGPDDGYLPSLKKLVADLEISTKVLFTGPLYGREKLKAYVDADVYVLPSSYEIFGITVLEACACGTPVIVTDNCGCSEWVKNSGAGYLVKYGDVLGLKEKMMKCLMEDSKAKWMAQQGQKYISNNLQWAQVVRKIEDIYTACISKEN